MHPSYLHLATAALVAFTFARAAFAANGKDTPATFDIRWGDQPAAALRTPVAPDASTRWCGALRKGDAVAWEFNSAEPLELAVTAMPLQDGRGASSVMSLYAVTEAKGTLEVAADQSYCWIWTNRTLSPVALQARLRKGTR